MVRSYPSLLEELEWTNRKERKISLINEKKTLSSFLLSKSETLNDNADNIESRLREKVKALHFPMKTLETSSLVT